MGTEVPAFSLPNVGTGPDPFSVEALPDDVDFVVVFLQRDHYCTNCRKQVQNLADRVDAFRSRDAELVSVVPEPVENVRDWQDAYDLPYPLLADPNARVGDDFDQPVRFGILGDVSDFLGRMPTASILDRRGDGIEIAWRYDGRSTFDRPEIDDVLEELDSVREGD